MRRWCRAGRKRAGAHDFSNGWRGRTASASRRRFARTSRDAAAQDRLVESPGEPVTLDRFRAVVERNVGRLTNFAQVARLYVPPTIPAATPIFDPPRPAVLAAGP